MTRKRKKAVSHRQAALLIAISGLCMLKLAATTLPTAPGSPVSAAIGLPHALGPVGTPEPALIPVSEIVLPLALRGALPAPTTGPTATELPLLHGPVIFQVATFGGLSLSIMLGYIPDETPWFTLYEDGTYVRRERETVDGDTRTVSRVGQLSEAQRGDLLKRLVDEAGFFDLPATVAPVVCATDLPDDRLYLAQGDREHRIVGYGLSLYGLIACPDPVDTRIVTLARIIVSLMQAPTSNEQALAIERGTLGARDMDSEPGPIPEWPLPNLPLRELPVNGWVRSRPLYGETARAAQAAIAAVARYGGQMADFAEDGKRYLVGFRVEFAGWDTYQ